MKFTTYRIAGGEKGIKQTLNTMADIVEDSLSYEPMVRRFAIEIVKKVPDKDYDGEIKAVYEWVKKNIRYVRDPSKVEMVHLPTRILEYRQGDCDDHAIINASLLGAIGHATRFVVVQVQPDSGTYDHVYTEAKLKNGKWIAMDTSNKKGRLGWIPNDVYKKSFISVTEEG